ncbi:hypothetical protein [Undibacterium sp. TC9W]|uniref:hypothetical protein n=1 Tax=Undibacterium sp. TC9W TaxID=3413053 RepID=UPI003BF3950C
MNNMELLRVSLFPGFYYNDYHSIFPHQQIARNYSDISGYGKSDICQMNKRMRLAVYNVRLQRSASPTINNEVNFALAQN